MLGTKVSQKSINFGVVQEKIMLNISKGNATIDILKYTGRICFAKMWSNLIVAIFVLCVGLQAYAFR